jgi:hypothetical protein
MHSQSHYSILTSAEQHNIDHPSHVGQQEVTSRSIPRMVAMRQLSRDKDSVAIPVTNSIVPAATKDLSIDQRLAITSPRSYHERDGLLVMMYSLRLTKPYRIQRLGASSTRTKMSTTNSRRANRVVQIPPKKLHPAKKAQRPTKLPSMMATHQKKSTSSLISHTKQPKSST